MILCRIALLHILQGVVLASWLRTNCVESNYHERLFLEAWHSTVDPNARNDHIVLPEAYEGITRA